MARSLPASTIEPANPFSREDGLTDRLKNLRNQADAASPIPNLVDKVQPQAETGASGTGTPSQTTDGSIGPLPQADDGTDPLLDTDDQTLEELLADLGSDEQWLDEIAAEVSRSKDEEHQRVTALLEEISRVPPEGSTAETRQSHVEDDDEDSGDDSDGERMNQETSNVLAQAEDEIEWDKANLSQEKPVKLHSPSEFVAKPGKGNNSTLFDLPAVPSELQEQSGLDKPTGEEADFEAQIISRMAALKGLGGTERSLPSAPTSQVDELGLPVAPTFAPGDRPVKGVYKRYGYTDEDAKTWCTICLEDGAVRCSGCDDDIYCARCWKEMHLGPSAGYDERTHRWETYVRGSR